MKSTLRLPRESTGPPCAASWASWLKGSAIVGGGCTALTEAGSCMALALGQGVTLGPGLGLQGFRGSSSVVTHRPEPAMLAGTLTTVVLMAAPQ